MTNTTATVPVVTSVGKTKIRIQAPGPEYALGLLEAQEFASRIALTLEQIEGGYSLPHEPTRKRTLRISPRRSIKISGGRKLPEIRLRHASVIHTSTEQAHELVAMIVSEIEATEDRLEALGLEPYPG